MTQLQVAKARLAAAFPGKYYAIHVAYSHHVGKSYPDGFDDCVEYSVFTQPGLDGTACSMATGTTLDQAVSRLIDLSVKGKPSDEEVDAQFENPEDAGNRSERIAEALQNKTVEDRP